MNKITEAKSILAAFNLPLRQQNDRSARVLLALLNLKENDSWKDASNKPIRIHEIISFILKNYGFKYAENSRETIRRQSIHQFEQAGIVIRNIDDPARPTNSGLTVYSIVTEALEVIRCYNSKEWDSVLAKFLSQSQTLIKKYKKIRKKHLISIKIRDTKFSISPGKHNKLQKLILEQFAPRFAEKSIVLYFGDTAHKQLYIDNELCERINIDIKRHEKLPDIILYNPAKNWLFLIEAVTSHGPVSFKRMIEIQESLKSTSSQLIFISAFPDFKTFLKYASEIAWETEVWIAENPAHLIHFDGEKFLGPA